jgi:hypothetical protein
VRNPGRKKPFGKPSRKLDVLIKLTVTEIGWDNVKRIQMAQDTDKW